MSRKTIKKTPYIESYNSTWKWEFNFFIGCKWQKFREAIYYYEDEWTQEREPTAHCFNNWGARRSFIWINKKNNPSSLAHECIHADTRCLNESGFTIICDNDEPLAYLVTWLMKEATGEKHR